MNVDIRQVLKTFIQHVEDQSEEDDDEVTGLDREFSQLRKLSLQYKEQNAYPSDEGKKECNLKKNRYRDIIPFDYSRVILEEIDNDPGSSYINANYIVDHKHDCSYIAAQGPMEKTVDSFWRMVWERNSEVIVMACKLMEKDKKKCEKYWPDEGTCKEAGKLKIRLLSEEERSTGYVIRSLEVEHSDSGEQRILTQFHYTEWPDRGIPKNLSTIIELISEMRQKQKRAKYPIVIHCSAGCGRTGTICAIDYSWNLLKSHNLSQDFSLYQIIHDMRTQRPSMVQTQDQYGAVHVAVKILFEQHTKMMDDHIYENVVIRRPGNTIYENVTGIDREDQIENFDYEIAKKVSVTESVVKKTVDEMFSVEDNEDNVRPMDFVPPSPVKEHEALQRSSEEYQPIADSSDNVEIQDLLLPTVYKKSVVEQQPPSGLKEDSRKQTPSPSSSFKENEKQHRLSNHDQTKQPSPSTSFKENEKKRLSNHDQTKQPSPFLDSKDATLKQERSSSFKTDAKKQPSFSSPKEDAKAPLPTSSFRAESMNESHSSKNNEMMQKSPSSSFKEKQPSPSSSFKAVAKKEPSSPSSRLKEAVTEKSSLPITFKNVENLSVSPPPRPTRDKKQAKPISPKPNISNSRNTEEQYSNVEDMFRFPDDIGVKTLTPQHVNAGPPAIENKKPDIKSDGEPKPNFVTSIIIGGPIFNSTVTGNSENMFVAAPKEKPPLQLVDNTVHVKDNDKSTAKPKHEAKPTGVHAGATEYMLGTAPPKARADVSEVTYKQKGLIVDSSAPKQETSVYMYATAPTMNSTTKSTVDKKEIEDNSAGAASSALYNHLYDYTSEPEYTKVGKKLMPKRNMSDDDSADYKPKLTVNSHIYSEVSDNRLSNADELANHLVSSDELANHLVSTDELSNHLVFPVNRKRSEEESVYQDVDVNEGGFYSEVYTTKAGPGNEWLDSIDGAPSIPQRHYEKEDIPVTKHKTRSQPQSLGKTAGHNVKEFFGKLIPTPFDTNLHRSHPAGVHRISRAEFAYRTRVRKPRGPRPMSQFTL